MDRPRFERVRIKDNETAEMFDFLKDAYDFPTRAKFLSFLVMEFGNMRENIEYQRRKIETMEMTIRILKKENGAKNVPK